MEPKTFTNFDEMETWATEHPDEVSRHILKAWREVIEGDKDVIIVVRCTNPAQYDRDMNIIVEKGEEEEALEALLQEAIDREDYEVAQEIQELQEKVDD